MKKKELVTIDISGQLPNGVTRQFVVHLLNTAYLMSGGKDLVEVTLSIVDDKEMTELNNRHRGINKPTDVLSFAYNETSFPVFSENTAVKILGEIVISAPTIKKQAKALSRRIKDEFALMLVHGLLHLQGFDHANQSDENRMFELQQDILMQEGII